MKPEKQRIAIAEACGYERLTQHEAVWKHEGSKIYTTGNLPNYLNDLNAMHQAEKVLTKNKSMEYAFRLADSWILNGEDKQPDLVRGFCATAAERAEAFLKTIGKWEDEA